MDTAEQAYRHGRASAELFTGFSAFLYRQAEALGIECLYFVTREGIFFKRAFEAIFEGPFGSNTIETHLLHASRFSVFSPSLISGSGIQVSDLFRLYPSQSPFSLLTSLGLDPSMFKHLVDAHQLNMHDTANTATSRRDLLAFLDDVRFRSLAIPLLKERRSATIRYFAPRFAAAQRIGLVEIGWRGTLQASIARLFPDREFVGLYLGLAADRNEMGQNCSRFAYGPNANESDESLDLLHAINVLEFVCLSECGSTVGYEAGTNGAEHPKLDPNEQENRTVREYSIPFQRGVLAEAKQMNAHELLRLHDTGELRQRALACWRNLLRKPNPALVNSYFSLVSNERFGHGEVSSQSVTPTLSELVTSLFSRKQRAKVRRFLIYTQWLEGMAIRKDLNPMHRHVLTCLMKAARVYKVLSQRHRTRLAWKTDSGA